VADGFKRYEDGNNDAKEPGVGRGRSTLLLKHEVGVLEAVSRNKLIELDQSTVMDGAEGA
jgi:hypothetical protein